MKRRIRSEISEVRISEVRISEVTFGVKQYLLYALQGLNESRLKKNCLEIPSDSIEDAYILVSALELIISFLFRNIGRHFSV